jgi:hypothetical protein
LYIHAWFFELLIDRKFAIIYSLAIKHISWLHLDAEHIHGPLPVVFGVLMALLDNVTDPRILHSKVLGYATMQVVIISVSIRWVSHVWVRVRAVRWNITIGTTDLTPQICIAHFGMFQWLLIVFSHFKLCIQVFHFLEFPINIIQLNQL